MEIENRKKVSCHVITYNHKDYISQCIEGILMQQTDFDFEIIIGDDVSTDGTREIVQDYAAKYPGLIKLNLREKRGEGIPGKENFVSTLEMCHGEYISLCDGDDYWTDPLKLQKQVDFLEANKDYCICFHKVNILKLNGEIVPDYITEIPEKYWLRETLAKKNNYIHPLSVVFHNQNLEFINSFEFSVSPIGDYFTFLMVARNGKIGFIDKTMGVYRFGVGVYSTVDQIKSFDANLKLFTALFSIEKDKKIKEIFYSKILLCLNQKNKIYDAVSERKIALEYYFNRQKRNVFQKFLDYIKNCKSDKQI